MGKRRNPKDIRRKAAYWFALIEQDRPSNSDRARFEAWLDEDPAHREAYEEMAALWDAAGDLSMLGDLERPDEVGKPPLMCKLIARPLPVFAAVLLIALLGLALLLGSSIYTAPGKTYVTAVGETRAFTLGDGSQVTLGPRSRLKVAYVDKARRVKLRSGEAFFEVARDAQHRPFRVEANAIKIEVISTQFNVHQGPRGFTVAVAEGEVEVAKTDPAARETEEDRDRRLLLPGQRILAPNKGKLTLLEEVSRETLGAWREGRLVYEDATLSEVVADAKRYFGARIEIEDGDLAQLRVVATFRLKDLDRLIGDLEESLPLVAERSGSDHIHLRREDQQDG